MTLNCSIYLRTIEYESISYCTFKFQTTPSVTSRDLAPKVLQNTAVDSDVDSKSSANSSGMSSGSRASKPPTTSVTDAVADAQGLPDMSKLKLMNLVLKLRKEMAAMQQQMSSLQDNMRAFNGALDHVIEHVCDNL